MNSFAQRVSRSGNSPGTQEDTKYSSFGGRMRIPILTFLMSHDLSDCHMVVAWFCLSLMAFMYLPNAMTPFCAIGQLATSGPSAERSFGAQNSLSSWLKQNHKFEEFVFRQSKIIYMT